MITESNKLIADFLGYVLIGKNTYEYNNKLYLLEEMKFHNDWNWLMEVVENIESLDTGNNSVVIGKNHCFLSFYDKYKNESIRFNGESKFANVELSKIEAVYNACIEFIKWYNTNPNT